MGRGLLYRLSAAAEGAGRTLTTEESVLENLRVLLNTRRGDSVALPEFGVPDFTDYLHNFPSGVHELQRALQQTIATYEPRLANVAVRPVSIAPEALTLHFEVTARLASGPRKVMRFATRVTRAGRVAVG